MRTGCTEIKKIIIDVMGHMKIAGVYVKMQCWEQKGNGVTDGGDSG